MIQGLMKICKAAEYLNVSPKRARILLANMGVNPIVDNPPIWRKADIDAALTGNPQSAKPACAPVPPPLEKWMVCKTVCVPKEYHAAIKAFAEGLGLEVRDLVEQLLVELVTKKPKEEPKATLQQPHLNGFSGESVSINGRL
jgi:hypothetical protein